MPVPPPTPNELTTSALPSPVVSRSSRTPPRGPAVATSRSPFSSTTMWREGPIDSATTKAQNPGCSVSPALLGAQAGRLACGVDAATSAATAASSSVRVMGTNIAFGATTRRGVVPSPHGLMLAAQAATAQPPRLAALKQDAVNDVASRAQFTQQMVDQIFSFA